MSFSLVACGEGVITVGHTRTPSSGGGLSIQGRIVDLNSCLRPPCQAVAGVVVRFGEGGPASAPSGPDGSFVIEGLSAGQSAFLYADDAPENGDLHLPTINAERAEMTEGEDLWSVNIYVTRRDSFFYRAIVEELGASVEEHALYLGQIFHLDSESESLKASGEVQVTSTPAASIRFRKARDEADQIEGFYNESYRSTGPTGQFLIVHPGDANLSVTLDDLTRGPKQTVNAAVKRGAITVGSFRLE